MDGDLLRVANGAATIAKQLFIREISWWCNFEDYLLIVSVPGSAVIRAGSARGVLSPVTAKT